MKKDRKKILVVDDSSTARMITSSVLRDYGFWVETAIDGEEGIKKAKSFSPDAMVVDLRMPKMDGFQVCENIKQLGKNQYIPVLLLTAREDVESVVRGLESGADDYITKPFNEMEFIARVKVLLRLKSLQDELQKANKKLERLSIIDGLTGIYNHRYFQEKFDDFLAKASKKNEHLVIGLFDLDYFKMVNDTYGHLIGDRVLKKITEILQQNIQQKDVLARYGGEEFVVIFPEATVNETFDVCQKFLKDIENYEFSAGEKTFKLTISGGLAAYKPGDKADKDRLIHDADMALYTSKREGRNRITISTP
ncbi:MAG: diguanylate cyclase [Candidatus Aureabacteria bacterium]|nr:diguanylate cyclase [Candidatus Auribacterota bacterium]